jgi:hypothetical protein
MKYLKYLEDYSTDQIENMLNRAKKDNLIDKNVDIQKIIGKLQDKPRIGTFEYFVYSKGDFVSAGDQQRMGEYIEKFKKLGLDTTRIEELYPKLQRYMKIEYKEIEDYNFGYDGSDEEKEKALNALYDESESLRKYVDEIKKEASKLAKQANEL